jgi:hypothetical protein
MSVTMISRLMLRLHRNATATSCNYSISTTDFGSAFPTSVVFNSRFAAGGSAMTGIESLTNMEMSRERHRSTFVVSLAQVREELEMDSRRWGS